jgi:hypothetical protein
MGIDIDSCLLVGLTYEDLIDGLDEDIDTQEWLEDLGLDEASPYYDAPRKDCIYGVFAEAWDSTITEVKQSMEEASAEFTRITGKQGKVFQSQNVW